MADNKNKASVTLVATTVLFLLSFPFGHTFLGGLAASVFSAAMVGGFADWFAVSALFRRPLGIPFRTAIIPKNRDRIFASIVNMLEKELLTGENVKLALGKAQLAKVLIEHLCREETKERLKDAVLKISAEWAKNFKNEEAARFLANLVRQHAGTIKLAPLIGGALAWAVRKGFVDKCLDLVLEECRQISAKDYLKNIIIDIYQKAKGNYQGDVPLRGIALFLIENYLHLTPEKVAELAQQQIAAYFLALQDEENSSRRRLKALLVKLAQDLRENPLYGEKLEKWKEDFLADVKLEQLLEKMVAVFTDYWGKNQAEREKYLGIAGGKIHTALTENALVEKKVDLILVGALSSWTNTHHSEIGKMAQEYLALWSNEKLVLYIEDKVGNDLQMIRINGSVVGGLTGLVLYLITFFLGV
jgi:uncharacterized membrane-anchored protein YjiN (DUF445 family)